VEAVAGDSYALTLWTWGHSVAQEKRDRLLGQGERLTLAVDVALGVNDPKKLKDRFRDYEDELGLRETAEDAVSKGIDLAAKVTLAAEMDHLLAQSRGTE
jgi:hypothetical protein